MPGSTRSATWLAVVIASAGATTIHLGAEARPVALPLFASLLIAACFFRELRARSSTVPLDEIGSWFLTAVTIYTVLPLVVFLLIGLSYTPLNDNRLFQLQPSPGEVGAVGWLYVMYLGAFAWTYLATRGPSVQAEPARPVFPPSAIGIAFTLWGVITVATNFLGTSNGLSGSSGTEGGYAMFAQLPLPLRQGIRLLSGMLMVLTVLLLAWLFSDFTRRRWIIAAWLLQLLLPMLTAVGSRAVIVLSLIACVMLFHRLVRPLSLRVAIIGGVLGLAVFLALGILRAFRGVASPGDFVVGVHGGEFESLFGNAVDLRSRLAAGEIHAKPLAFYVGDLVSFLPSQVLPFQKVDLADWYIATFYPEARDAGSGFAFGAIAEAVLGWGWLEALVRGAIVGYLYARLNVYYRRYGQRMWVTVFHLWMTLWCYNAFRNSTFTIVSSIVQQFIPTMVLVEVARAGLRLLPARHFGSGMPGRGRAAQAGGGP